MGFSGFPAAAFDFYTGLCADNSKAYWTAHKDTYESAVRAPMAELFAELAPEFGAGRLARPYRDMRFSKAASPYKTRQYGFTETGCFLSLDAGGLTVAGGMYAPAAEQLARYRAAVDAAGPGGRLTAIIDDLVAGGFEIGGDRLKTRPRGVPADHPRLELLRHRALIAYMNWSDEPWLHTPEARDKVAAAWRALRPILTWVDDHVGRAVQE
ncbi:MAG TPA: DUF2461 domain-containing protein [Streptosporangiaceae bacterium]